MNIVLSAFIDLYKPNPDIELFPRNCINKLIPTDLLFEPAEFNNVKAESWILSLLLILKNDFIRLKFSLTTTYKVSPQSTYPL